MSERECICGHGLSAHSDAFKEFHAEPCCWCYCTHFTESRNCAACGADCRRKKVGEKRGRKVICMACWPYWAFTVDGDLIRSYDHARP